MNNGITNIIVAGLGGHGVLKASAIVADVAFRSGLDVKQSELHGMSQRGGSVSSDVRFGPEVFSPMVPTGEAHFLVVVSPDQVEAGPYWSAAVALEAAFRQALLARHRGVEVDVFVRDDGGDTHRCMLFDELESCDPCYECERSWLSFPQPAQCPLLSNSNVH